MMTNLIPHRYLCVVLLAFLVACVKQTVALPTETLVPTVVLPTFIPTSTFIPVTIMPSPLPPQPTIAVFTPEQEILKSVIQSYFDIRYLAFNSLQLDGLGDLVSDEPDAKVFLDAELGKLAVRVKHIRLNNLRYADYKYFLDFRNIVVDESFQTTTILVVEENEVIYELSMRLDPVDPIVSHAYNIEHTIVLRKEQDQWKIVSDYYNDYLWRMLRQTGNSTDEVTDEMLRTIKAVPLPTQAMKAVIRPEPAELERWNEYENAVAKKLMPLAPPKKVLCEWELSGRSDQEVYVWAVCMETIPAVEISPFFFPVVSIPAVIHLGADGDVQNVEIPEYGLNYMSDILRMFPLDAQKGVVDIGRMEEHLDLRREHPEEPPLIVLNAIPTPTGTP